MFLLLSSAFASAPLATCHEGDLQVLGTWTDAGLDVTDAGRSLGPCVHEGALHVPGDVVELRGQPMREQSWTRTSVRYGRWLETWEDRGMGGTLALQGPYGIAIEYDFLRGCMEGCAPVHATTHWIERDGELLVLVHTSGDRTRKWTAYALGEATWTETEIVLETGLVCLEEL